MPNKSQKPQRVPLTEGYQPVKKGYSPTVPVARPVPPRGGTGVVNAPIASGNGSKPPER